MFVFLFKESLCRQPVAISTAVENLVMMPIHIAGMFAMYTYMSKKFNQNVIAQKLRHKRRLRRPGAVGSH